MEVAALIPNNYYVGCYADSSSNRDLWAASSSSGNGSIALCASFCSSYYTPYFGLQNGDQCFCGYSYGSQGTSTACTMKCTADPTETCGGVFANSIYRVQLNVEPLTIAYEGCYNDNSNSRDLPVRQPDIGTIQECASYCSTYKYFGVQFASQCFCGNKYGSYGSSTGCNSHCNGNSTQTCGGANANSIYSYSSSIQRHTININ